MGANIRHKNLIERFTVLYRGNRVFAPSLRASIRGIFGTTANLVLGDWAR